MTDTVKSAFGKTMKSDPWCWVALGIWDIHGVHQTCLFLQFFQLTNTISSHNNQDRSIVPNYAPNPIFQNKDNWNESESERSCICSKHSKCEAFERLTNKK